MDWHRHRFEGLDEWRTTGCSVGPTNHVHPARPHGRSLGRFLWRSTLHPQRKGKHLQNRGNQQSNGYGDP